jgi:hypothetical protein
MPCQVNQGSSTEASRMNQVIYYLSGNKLCLCHCNVAFTDEKFLSLVGLIKKWSIGKTWRLGSYQRMSMVKSASAKYESSYNESNDLLRFRKMHVGITIQIHPVGWCEISTASGWTDPKMVNRKRMCRILVDIKDSSWPSQPVSSTEARRKWITWSCCFCYHDPLPQSASFAVVASLVVYW